MLQQVDGDVRGQMVDPVERLAERERVGLGRGDPDQQRAGQARAGGDRDRVEVGAAHAGRVQRAVHGRDHRLEVGPAGDLGHHPAEPRVLVDAGRDRVGEQLEPRTMPTPVSSQEVSMPSTGAAVIVGQFELIVSESMRPWS